MADKDPSIEFPRRRIQIWTLSGVVIAALAYEILVVALLYKELMATSLRATDRVIILLGLLFFPLLLSLMGRLVGGSRLFNLKLPGNLELNIERLQEQVAETKNRQLESEITIDKKIDRKAQELEEHLDGKLSTAELTLYPIIGGPNVFAKDRLRRRRVIIGSKDFAANIVVAELLAQHMESYGIQCERRIPNGGTVANYACLINGWIDLAVDYTGTGCLFFNIDHRGKSKDEILGILNRLSKERYGLTWLEPLGTKTNYCLVIKTDAKNGNIDRISDLESWHRGKLRFCGNYEFMNRRDGLLGLKECYNLRFSREIISSYRDRYSLVNSGEADVTIGHTTDPKVNAFGLKVLDDDRKFFPDYYEVPVVRGEALELIAGLETAVSDLAGLKVNDADITSLIQDYEENSDSLNGAVRSLLTRKKQL